MCRVTACRAAARRIIVNWHARMPSGQALVRACVPVQVSERSEPAMPTPFTDKGRKGNALISPSLLRDVNIHLMKMI